VIRPTLAVVLAGLTCSVLAQTPRMKVILDTDIGDDIDDAWALAFLLAHQGFEPLGITIAHGNTPGRAPIACKMLYLARRDQIPVSVGRKTNDQRAYQFSWAEDFTRVKPVEQDAAHFIVDMARKYRGDLTLIAVGPLQNVADALRLEPQLPKLLKRVVFMSGCIYGTAGRDGPIPEWNVVSSTQDSQLVYAAGLPLTIVPLDSTTRIQLSDEERERVRKHDSPLTHALEALYRLWIESPRARMTLHDQLAVAETANAGTFFGKKETLPIVVDDQGYTRIDKAKGKPVTVCLEPKRDDFMNYYIGELVSQTLGK
jgi:purine nucleosidase